MESRVFLTASKVPGRSHPLGLPHWRGGVPWTGWATHVLGAHGQCLDGPIREDCTGGEGLVSAVLRLRIDGRRGRSRPTLTWEQMMRTGMASGEIDGTLALVEDRRTWKGIYSSIPPCHQLDKKYSCC